MSRKQKRVQVIIRQASVPIDIDAWAEQYVKLLLELEGINAPPIRLRA
jgi:hypothetical protein